MIQADAAAAPDPIVTTIIPTFRRPALLRRAIDTVLEQADNLVRVAVYDNASGDATDEVVKELARRDPRVRYQVQPENLGPFENFRTGLTSVRTPFFSILSDDDLLLPGFYETALQALQAHPTAQFAVTRVLVVDPSGRLLDIAGRSWQPGYYDAPQGSLEMIRLGHVPWTGTLFRREIIAKTGGFDPQTAAVFDLDFLLRAATRCPFVICDRVGGVYVIETSMVTLERTLTAWEKMIDNVGKEAELSPSQRMKAQSDLRHQLAALTFRIGRAAARRGDLQGASAAARALRERFEDRTGARVIELSAQFCRRVAFARTALALVLATFRAARSIQLHTLLQPHDRRWLRTARIG